MGKRLGRNPLDEMLEKGEEGREGEGGPLVPSSAQETQGPDLEIVSHRPVKVERFSITLDPDLAADLIALCGMWKVVDPSVQKKDIYNRMVREFLAKYGPPVRRRVQKAIR